MTTKIKRYKPSCGDVGLLASDDGYVVLASDYDALSARLAEAEKELARYTGPWRCVTCGERAMVKTETTFDSDCLFADGNLRKVTATIPCHKCEKCGEVTVGADADGPIFAAKTRMLVGELQTALARIASLEAERDQALKSAQTNYADAEELLAKIRKLESRGGGV